MASIVRLAGTYIFRCLHLSVCLVLSAGSAFASDASKAVTDADSGKDGAAQERAMEQVREELADLDQRWYLLTRIRTSYPQVLSAGLGVMFAQQPEDADCATVCMVRGWHFEVEPGIHGLQAGVGWGKLVGETGSTEHLMHTVYFAWAVRAVALRTWGDTPLEPKSQTLAGIEGDFSIIRLSFSLALMRSLSSGAGEDWLVSAGVGWGF